MEQRKNGNNRRRRILPALTAVLTAAVLLLTGCGNRTASPEETTIAVEGSAAPDFTVELFDGGRVTLSELRGQVVLVSFWATWCPPCREELARVQHDIVDRFAGREFRFLPISRGETRDEVAAFREKMGYRFAMGLDPDQAIYEQYARQYIPRNFVIDASGRVVMATVGYDPGEFEAMTAEIERLLGE